LLGVAPVVAVQEQYTGGAPGRPASGFGHYLRDMVYGGVDGVITTLAVISGATGANLEPRVGLILGAANLVADGISMGASNYLGLKSELLQSGASVKAEKPWRHGAATTGAFAVVGAVPLAVFVLPCPPGLTPLAFAIGLAAAALAVAGALRGPYVGKPPWRSAGEMLFVGMLATAAAYAVGAAADRLTR
jgi:VIT1/CCC1 family predicted Fe2+/Mn2+ transporter